jgi:hypothetical protein
MSIYYTINIAIGYRFSPEELLKSFTFSTEETSHMEKRFNPKTGEELPEVKVITTKSYKYYQIDNRKICTSYDAIEAICHKLNCGFYSGGYDDDNYFVLVPKKEMKPFYPGQDLGKVEYGDSYKLIDVVSFQEELQDLELKLTALGIKVPEAGVHLVCHGG